jgi:hypothetical protein
VSDIAQLLWGDRYMKSNKKSTSSGESLELFVQPILGKAEKMITATHPGRVQAMATSWPAELLEVDENTHIFPGESVTIMGRRGITLLVMPGDPGLGEFEPIRSTSSSTSAPKPMVQKLSAFMAALRPQPHPQIPLRQPARA